MFHSCEALSPSHGLFDMVASLPLLQFFGVTQLAIVKILLRAGQRVGFLQVPKADFLQRGYLMYKHQRVFSRKDMAFVRSKLEISC